MKTGLTDITVVLDRSGSMGSRVTDTIGGFNAFVEKQKAEPGEARLSLVQFDDHYEPNYGPRLLANVPALTPETYVPRGSTALLDALGRTITEKGAHFAALPESERPEKVILVVITDGLENASTAYTRTQIHSMIAHQRDVYHWIVLFMGTNQDAITEAAKIGIPFAHAASYDPHGTRKVYDIMSDKLAQVRSSSLALAAAYATFTSAERADLATPDADVQAAPGSDWTVTAVGREARCTCLPTAAVPSAQCPVHGVPVESQP